MMDEDWAELLTFDDAPSGHVIEAQTFIRSWESACRAIHVGANDGNDYVVKGTQAGRSVFNEQVVGRLATLIGAPVSSVCFIRIPSELVSINPEMAHVTPGLAHGNLYIPDCTECEWFNYVDLSENRHRFSLLAVLYGWIVGAEKQFFYRTQPPNLVYSFDHDAFFPSGPDWTAAGIGHASHPDVDSVIVDNCGLRHTELNSACKHLLKITREHIASAINAVPRGWGRVGAEERKALANYLWERCKSIRN